MEFQEIIEGLSAEQKDACTTKSNTYLTACPGSGKTLVLTRRLACLATTNPQSRKWNIAITYTNRAADEISNRLDALKIDQTNIWTGTIHQFCMQFIIRPYAMYSSRLAKGYTIIDEYTKREYCNVIAKKLGITLKLYDDPFEWSQIKEKYFAQLETNKEIDFDQILQFSNDLVSTREYICFNIASILNSILVDEFQDTHESQYEILAKICRKNKSISLLFVGDVNQAIFGNLGGIVKSKAEIEALYDTVFVEKSLTGCYRSTQRVVDFYTEFEVAATGVKSIADIKDVRGKLTYNSSISKDELAERIAALITTELASGVPPTEICVVAPQWQSLFNISSDLKQCLPEVPFDAPDISPFKYDPMNPFYLLARLTFTQSGQNVSLRKKVASELLAILRDDFKIAIPEHIDNYDVLRIINRSLNQKEDGLAILMTVIRSVFQQLGISLESEDRLCTTSERFFEKAKDRIKRHGIATDYMSIARFFLERQGVVVSTIHGIKGEEYSTVIALSLLNGHLPHWDYIMKDEMKPLRRIETQKLLYVLGSRAKKNIYLFSETGYKTNKGNNLTATDELIEGVQRLKVKHSEAK
ncbi:MAG: ATP-dependent helicase [Lachnospiraceae bacterium]|nr:ATP-dependent helicase [Lachnospiraceae bacterium]